MVTDELPWTIKYAPKDTASVIGQTNVVIKVKSYIQTYFKQKKKGMLIYGTAGSGKTSTVYAIAKELDLELIEVNASDYRNKDAIESIVGNASKQMSLFGTGKIILVDEVDGLAGNKDRGGIQALVRMLKASKHPIIMTCNDPYDKKFSSLRKDCDVIQFEPLKYTQITQMLMKICDAENISYEESAIKQLARQSDGDLRAAINDLETISATSKKLIMDDLDFLGDRIKKEQIQDALTKIFKMNDPMMVKDAFFNVNEDINLQMLWLDENVPKEYKDPKDLARAYEMLSKADVYLGRIRRRQHWGFLSVAGSLMSSGICVAKDKRSTDSVEYVRPTRILELWKAKMANLKKDSISHKIANKCHVSLKRARKEFLLYIKSFCKNNNYCDQIANELDFSIDEKEWLKK